jgi:hypothetical protein
MPSTTTQTIRAALVAAAALTLAALACGPRGSQPADTRATVEAVYATVSAEALYSPVPSDTPTLTEPPPSATPSLTPTPPEERSGNGPNPSIARCTSAVGVDGDLGEWDEQVGVTALALSANTFGEDEWLGVNDLSGQARLCWTDANLYLAVEVEDDVHVQDQRGAASWQGDEVELVVDADLRGDYYDEVWNDDDTQLGLSPGDFGDLSPAAVEYHPSVQEDVGVQVAARQPLEAGGGYRLEAAIPWAVLGISPKEDTAYGLCVALSDDDHVGEAQQDSMVSHCPELAIADPTTWATVRLMP